MNRRDFLIKSGAVLGGLYTARLLGNKYQLQAQSSVFKNDAPAAPGKHTREAYHYTAMGRNVRCSTCPNHCLLEPGDRGICRAKVNINGKLYNTAYGNPAAVNIDPIEKKPLYHFYPGSRAFSIACGGCPLRCLNCQNWSLSQSKPEELRTYNMFPQTVVKEALINDCQSIAYTYSEPIAWYRYMYDTAKAARQKKIHNIWITSGYIEEKALEHLCPVIDAANVDLKSFSDSIYQTLNAGKLDPVLRTLRILHQRQIWMEITCLLVPGYSDDMQMIKDMCAWIVDTIGPDYPLHFSRFHSDHKLRHVPPTPRHTMYEAHDIAREEGIHHVYLGNMITANTGLHTYCPHCGKILIKRRGYIIEKNNIKDSCCPFCKTVVSGRW
ncbi:MAG TPA: AmmeMemoRadiSam system radical SAM enzyme [Spirochaetota bacterium]|nr:AmmeMemoRadiSam system radical SAM enzyme [Spirochaetota bacterium]